DLMPYEALDVIERLAIRDRLLPDAACERAIEALPQYDRQHILTWVKKFYRLWRINQWKRERYATSFHLDDENLDPKTWCRFPILSGPLEREFDDLA
ncbi:MAG: NAD+ synthetase, partial [Planctomycetales bacterium]|nr:NAD+ synthetase [Planctomycetales bacterium]